MDGITVERPCEDAGNQTPPAVGFVQELQAHLSELTNAASVMVAAASGLRSDAGSALCAGMEWYAETLMERVVALRDRIDAEIKTAATTREPELMEPERPAFKMPEISDATLRSWSEWDQLEIDWRAARAEEVRVAVLDGNEELDEDEPGPYEAIKRRCEVEDRITRTAATRGFHVELKCEVLEYLASLEGLGRQCMLLLASIKADADRMTI